MHPVKKHSTYSQNSRDAPAPSPRKNGHGIASSRNTAAVKPYISLPTTPDQKMIFAATCNCRAGNAEVIDPNPPLLMFPFGAW